MSSLTIDTKSAAKPIAAAAAKLTSSDDDSSSVLGTRRDSGVNPASPVKRDIWKNPTLGQECSSSSSPLKPSFMDESVRYDDDDAKTTPTTTVATTPLMTTASEEKDTNGLVLPLNDHDDDAIATRSPEDIFALDWTEEPKDLRTPRSRPSGAALSSPSYPQPPAVSVPIPQRGTLEYVAPTYYLPLWPRSPLINFELLSMPAYIAEALDVTDFTVDVNGVLHAIPCEEAEELQEEG